MTPSFLPVSRKEAKSSGVEKFDVILISGDAYVDHPSFGAAIIGRVLQDAGYSVGIIPQPDWRRDEDFRKLGEPRLFFGITSGNVDSMVNSYTPNKKRRSSDVYSPGGSLRRPDRAAIVYADKVHSLFPKTPLILGGIEASLRRFAHYDYWSDSVRQSILADAPADVIVFGMGEKALLQIADRLSKGEAIQDINDVAGTQVKMAVKEWRNADKEGYVTLPSFEEVSKEKRKYAEAFRLHYQEQDPYRGRPVAQAHPKTVTIQNRPALPLSTEELDHVYELPYTRMSHPSYKDRIPALEPVKFSITTHRGCFGSCAFCALTHHQGRILQSRSEESILREAEKLAKMPDFKGVIQDVGGPTANMYGMSCTLWKSKGACPDRFCSSECPTMKSDHRRQLELLRKLRAIPGVKRVFVASGIRHDLISEDAKSGSEYLMDLCRYHVSGHLKIAPEHVSRRVTDIMHKPSCDVLERFRSRFDTLSEKIGREQYLLPYFMSGHPGCTLEDMIELAEYIRDHTLYTEQVQDFTPTPMTVSTCMYHTGLDPFTMEDVYVPKDREKKIQRALLHYRDPRNWGLIREGLRMARREDLIGNSSKCLVPAAKKKSHGKKGPRRKI